MQDIIPRVNVFLAACASAVTEALGAAGQAPDTPEADARGESLLLPLLQGLLGGGGERLLAGLGAAGADVVADVRRSLARLRSALAPPAAVPQARALLALADRLEDALDVADRLDGCKRRARRRPRANRHTVGVTREELDEARRLVDRDQLALGAPASPAPADHTPSSASEEPPTPERQCSMDDDVSFHDAVPAQRKRAPEAHTASLEPTPVVTRDCAVERRAPAPRKPDFFRHSIADSPQAPPPQTVSQALPRMERRPSDSAKNGIAAIANKFNAQIQKEAPPVRRAPQRLAPTQQKPAEDRLRAPLYKPLPPTYNFAVPPQEEPAKPLGRFNSSRRGRMKRANTIDIGRQLNGYRPDSDTDEETRRRLVPPFQPQTDNDRKFVAFMQKNNENSAVNGHANWSSRFGNIKHAFETKEQEDRSRSSSGSSRRGWQEPQGRATRKVLADVNTDVRPPWTPRAPPRPAQAQPAAHPLVPQSPPAKPVVKPFAAKPIPVNQFSHAPMSAFKPPKKIVSPVNAPSSLVWTPPSVVSPTERPTYPSSPKPTAPSPIPTVPWATAEDKPRRTVSKAAAKFEGDRFNTRVVPPSYPSRYNLPTSPSYVPPRAQNYPVKSIPSQNNLAAPELVKKMNTVQPAHEYPYQTYEPPHQTYERPQQTYEPPEQIYEPPQQPYKPPQQTYEPPQQTYKPPQQTYKPPQQMYEPPQQTYEPPHQAYAPPQQTYEPPLKTYAPPSQKYEPPQRTYEPQQQTYDPPHKTYVPPPQTYEPPHKTSPLPQQNYEIPYQSYEPQNREHEPKPAHRPQHQTYTPKIDAQRLQIEFYEKQIREKARTNGYPSPPAAHTQPHPLADSFVPLQQTPDIEKARAHKVDYLPDVVLNEAHAELPSDGETTEHGSVATRVMRGPVRQAATITAGVRTRNGPDELRAVLAKPRPRAQVPTPTPALAPPAAPAPLAPPRSPTRSQDSASSLTSSPLSRSGSCQRLDSEPRRIVSRAKSMHLLAAPKMFEGGIAREEVREKKKTVEAYFSGHTKPVRRGARAANPYALGRSRTMPSVTELQFLDESNADDAFEDLVSGLA